MAESVEFKRLRKSFKAQLRKCRGHLAAANLFIDSADLSRAFDEAEQAQHAAYDAKNLLTMLVLDTVDNDPVLKKKREEQWEKIFSEEFERTPIPARADDLTDEPGLQHDHRKKHDVHST